MDILFLFGLLAWPDPGSLRGGFGIHWPDLDEDLSTEGLLKGQPAPRKTFINVA